MAENQQDLAKWSLEKAEQYLLSAKENLEEGRHYVAAEEIFRAIETSLEAFLYKDGVTKITYPGKGKEFTGRLALQLLIKERLLKKNAITKEDNDNYLAYASKLHQAGYKYGSFQEKQLEDAIAFAEELYHRALAN